MRVGVVGCGSVGARVARQLIASGNISDLAVCDRDEVRAAELARSLGASVVAPRNLRDTDVDGLVLAVAAGEHFALARDAVAAGQFVVSTSDALADVQLLKTLDRSARERGVPVLLGAGFAPGLTCLLAQLGAGWFDAVHEVHVARVGTGGPACARQHHDAFRSPALDWRDGAWLHHRGGSGRELCWFPDPVGGRDCYRAATADTVLMVDAFPSVHRVSARTAATRRDRLTMHLPMLRPPHVEGGVGAIRVELRGRVGDAVSVVVLGAIDRPGVAAGVVAAQACLWVGAGRVPLSGAMGLGLAVEAKPFLRELATRGVRAALFDGMSRRPGDRAPDGVQLT